MTVADALSALEAARERHQNLLDDLSRVRLEREAEEQALERRAAFRVLPGGGSS